MLVTRRCHLWQARNLALSAAILALFGFASLLLLLPPSATSQAFHIATTPVQNATPPSVAVYGLP